MKKTEVEIDGQHLTNGLLESKLNYNFFKRRFFNLIIRIKELLSNSFTEFMFFETFYFVSEQTVKKVSIYRKERLIFYIQRLMFRLKYFSTNIV